MPDNHPIPPNAGDGSESEGEVPVAGAVAVAGTMDAGDGSESEGEVPVAGAVAVAGTMDAGDGSESEGEVPVAGAVAVAGTMDAGDGSESEGEKSLPGSLTVGSSKGSASLKNGAPSSAVAPGSHNVDQDSGSEFDFDSGDENAPPAAPARGREQYTDEWEDEEGPAEELEKELSVAVEIDNSVAVCGRNAKSAVKAVHVALPGESAAVTNLLSNAFTVAGVNIGPAAPRVQSHDVPAAVVSSTAPIKPINTADLPTGLLRSIRRVPPEPEPTPSGSSADESSGDEPSPPPSALSPCPRRARAYETGISPSTSGTSIGTPRQADASPAAAVAKVSEGTAAVPTTPPSSDVVERPRSTPPPAVTDDPHDEFEVASRLRDQLKGSHPLPTAISIDFAVETIWKDGLWRNFVESARQKARKKSSTGFVAMLGRSFTVSLPPNASDARDFICALAEMPLDHNHHVHVAALRTIYCSITGTNCYTISTLGSVWHSIGFQGDDPGTDFRAAGILGLLQMLWLVSIYPAAAAHIGRTSRIGSHQFPFSLISITLTANILIALREKHLHKLLIKKIGSLQGVEAAQMAFTTVATCYGGLYREFFDTWTSKPSREISEWDSVRHKLMERGTSRRLLLACFRMSCQKICPRCSEARRERLCIFQQIIGTSREKVMSLSIRHVCHRMFLIPP